jgi:hypothetical protein
LYWRLACMASGAAGDLRKGRRHGAFLWPSLLTCHPLTAAAEYIRNEVTFLELRPG